MMKVHQRFAPYRQQQLLGINSLYDILVTLSDGPMCNETHDERSESENMKLIRLATPRSCALVAGFDMRNGNKRRKEIHK